MNNNSFTVRVRKSWVRTALVVAVTAAIAAPIGAFAADRFTDVPDTNIFHDDITWLAEAGVTQGCNPPANDEFCPGDPVTRQQMAAFMRRLADSQAVDAGTLEGVGADGFVGAGAADSVTPAMTTAEPGVAQAASDTTVVLDGTVEALLTVTITAPAAGYVMVTGSADAFMQHTNGTQDFAFFGVSDQSVDIGLDENKDIILTGAAPTGLYSEVVSMQKVYPVTAGANMFYLLGEENTGNVQMGDMQLVAVYFPTAYGPVEMVSTPAGAPSGSDVVE